MFVFYFEHETAYEMHISDWSSDVCSSDLAVTDDILAMLEAGTNPWVKPWSGGPTIPLRHNGVAYRGINVLSLWASAMRQGFASPYWLTFKQALELGGNVRKGSKGTTVVYANKLVMKDSETDDERAI